MTENNDSFIGGLLVKLSHVAQIGLLILAVFGYFYTVKPIHSKALLEEQIAKKEITLDKVNKKLAHSSNELSNTNARLLKTQNNLSKTIQDYEKIKNDLITAKKETVNLNRILIANAIDSVIFELDKQCSPKGPYVGKVLDCNDSSKKICEVRYDAAIFQKAVYFNAEYCLFNRLRSIPAYNNLDHETKDILMHLARTEGASLQEEYQELADEISNEAKTVCGYPDFKSKTKLNNGACDVDKSLKRMFAPYEKKFDLSFSSALVELRSSFLSMMH